MFYDVFFDPLRDPEKFIEFRDEFTPGLTSWGLSSDRESQPHRGPQEIRGGGSTGPVK